LNYNQNKKKTEQMWSQALGNEKAAMNSVSDLQSKFSKRWTELSIAAFSTPEHRNVNNDNQYDGTEQNGPVSGEKAYERSQIQMTKQIHELQHKLQQSMDSVRQTELTRENLKMAIAMNATLQSKLEEMKQKHTAIQTATRTGTAPLKSSNRGESHGKNGISTTADDTLLPNVKNDDVVNNVSLKDDKNSRKEKVESKSPKAELVPSSTNGAVNRSSTSLSSSEKLHRDYRKTRKELATVTANHTTLLSNNARLLKQITEKDEMNAKSLSTILHLKSTTEKLVEERDHLELQMKNASQLALAARLATNAKERVSEELLKEKDDLDTRRIDNYCQHN
jgi:E3 ubiquitin-protein ligase BRE1